MNYLTIKSHFNSSVKFYLLGFCIFPFILFFALYSAKPNHTISLINKNYNFLFVFVLVLTFLIIITLFLKVGLAYKNQQLFKYFSIFGITVCMLRINLSNLNHFSILTKSYIKNNYVGNGGFEVNNKFHNYIFILTNSNKTEKELLIKVNSIENCNQVKEFLQNNTAIEFLE